MIRVGYALVVGLVGCVTVVPAVAGVDEEAQRQASADAAADLAAHLDRSPIRFVARPIDGAPAQRARSIGRWRDAYAGQNGPAELYVLLPEEVAITTQAQPSLFWYISAPIDRPVRLSLYTPHSSDSVLELELDASQLWGIQRLDLSKLAVRLKPGIRYDWVVTVVPIDGVTAPRVYAKSVVWRVDTTDTLVGKLLQTRDRRQRAALAAQEGVWVDALAGISDLIEHNPHDSSLRRDRADLLRQAGFSVAIRPEADKGFREEVRFVAAP